MNKYLYRKGTKNEDQFTSEITFNLTGIFEL